MIFTSLTFLVFFAFVYLSIYISNSNKTRIRILLLASYFFYGWWDYRFTALLFFVSLSSWFLGEKIHNTLNIRQKKTYLTISLVISLSTLAFFKYFNFFIDSFYTSFGLDKSTFWSITLPVGISFYIFQAMSYNIDLYRKKIEPAKSLEKYLLFVSFFPQLVAGPIVRAIEFLPQLDKTITLTKENLTIGIQLFIAGAIQKILFADTLGLFVDPVFSEPNLYSTETIWLAMFAFAGQIFGDFSGYSLMAIGVARCFGFTLPENFRMPYISTSITEFWRRWHKSLSFWLRDYLYISLGGNRKGAKRTYFNLMATMTLGGLWHGASWNFVIWGLLHGLFLAIHKFWLDQSWAHQTTYRFLSFTEKFFKWAVTFLLVCLLWVPFRAESYQLTLDFMHRLFTPQLGIHWFHSQSCIVLLLMFLWHIFYLGRPNLIKATQSINNFSFGRYYFLCMSVLIIFMFSPEETSPFVYFQF